MATRHLVADATELEENGDRVLTDVKGTEIAVFRIDDEFYAVANFCVHQGGPLCEGDLAGKYEIGDDGWAWTHDSRQRNITCPWHGWKFDVTTGTSIDDDRYQVPTYDVEVEDGNVYVRR
ncbi:MAG: Rieske (2Fe-2S) protein [Haloarculaceae archaeon]